MNSCGARMLSMQGYDREDVLQDPNIGRLARWTLFALGCFGALAFTGALSPRSIYERLCRIFTCPFAGLGDMLCHGIPRRAGCRPFSGKDANCC